MRHGNNSRRRLLTVGWYGGRTRNVTAVTSTGQWHKSSRGLVPIPWLFVRDQSATHRDEYFFTTDPKLTPAAMVGLYTGRWNIETTFQELRSHLGLETTRGWCEHTILRLAPCLFGLYTAVALVYQTLPAARRGTAVQWRGKATVTFSDALAAVRRWLWVEGVLPQAGGTAAVAKIPTTFREIILSALAPAN